MHKCEITKEQEQPRTWEGLTRGSFDPQRHLLYHRRKNTYYRFDGFRRHEVEKGNWVTVVCYSNVDTNEGYTKRPDANWGAFDVVSYLAISR